MPSANAAFVPSNTCLEHGPKQSWTQTISSSAATGCTRSRRVYFPPSWLRRRKNAAQQDQYNALACLALTGLFLSFRCFSFPALCLSAVPALCFFPGEPRPLTRLGRNSDFCSSSATFPSLPWVYVHVVLGFLLVPLLSFHFAQSSKFKVVHCAHAACAPSFASPHWRARRSG